MARRLIYKIADDGKNFIGEQEWQQIQKLQNWYNSEFIWSAGKLAFKMFLIFPNYESSIINKEEYRKRVKNIQQVLKLKGATELELIRTLEANGLIFTRKGGYFENCLASGYTRVGQNEFNAYLVCDFLIKVSFIATRCTIEVEDEGNFIKCKKIYLREGDLIVLQQNTEDKILVENLLKERRIFSIVNPQKYEYLPKLKHQYSNYNKYSQRIKHRILHNWNWLGFENTYDFEGDDIEGYDLNKKVKRFIMG